jgi:ferredoxin
MLRWPTRKETFMTEATRKILLCSCEDTMPVDAAAVGRGCPGTTVSTSHHLCRSEIAKFTAAAREGGLTVACTQEEAAFRSAAEDAGLSSELTFVNVREMAGWSSEAAAAGPKMAALLAAAAVVVPPPPAVTYVSEGIALILGRNESAIAAAKLLADHLDITVLLTGDEDVPPPQASAFPIRFGRVKSAKGYLGAFEVTIDGFSEPAASSRAKLVPGPVRNGAVSKPHVILDLTGRPPLFSAHDLREGYLRADPGDQSAVLAAVLKARELTGTFDKPRYVTFKPDLCAHSRSRITGCTRCLDVCPAGAISPAGNMVAIDPHICGGCGSCAAVCPTGAASYAVPAADLLMQQLRAALVAYRTAGGTVAPLVLVHDRAHGQDVILAAARFGDGLPAHAIPLAVSETTQLGIEQCSAALAYGAAGVRVLTRAKPKHDIASLRATLEMASTLGRALGYGGAICSTIETDDPDHLVAALRGPVLATPAKQPSSFLPQGGKRDIQRLALREMHRVAPAPVETVALPKGAPFGAVNIKSEGCTLCLACVAACPPHALTANDDRPQLNFDESLCVQCGLCAATCPERVITLDPRLNFAAFSAGPVTLKEEEPFCCTRCSKPFGVKSTIDKITAKLEGQHWMFSGGNSSRLDLIRMCDTCRVEVVTNEGIDPYAGAARAAPKTSDDYLREREAAMLAKIAKGDA